MSLNIRRLVESGISPQAAKELQTQFDKISGGEKPALEEVSDSEATTIAALRDDFNDLLRVLRDYGVIA